MACPTRQTDPAGLSGFLSGPTHPLPGTGGFPHPPGLLGLGHPWPKPFGLFFILLRTNGGGANILFLFFFLPVPLLNWKVRVGGLGVMRPFSDDRRFRGCTRTWTKTATRHINATPTIISSFRRLQKSWKYTHKKVSVGRVLWK